MDRSLVSHPHSASQPRRAVPHYFLYGEHASRAAPGFVHIETLSSRSALHDWEIAPHLHDGLQQVLWVREGGGEARLDRERVAFVAPSLIVVPAAFTHTTGMAHWEVLLRARAIENQCYVLASAQGGTHPNGRRTFGHSMLIDPWGVVQDVLPEGEGVVSGAIDPEYLASVRASLPALKHRKL